MFGDPETAIIDCRRRRWEEKENLGESVLALQRGERENLQMKNDVVVIWQDLRKFKFSWNFTR